MEDSVTQFIQKYLKDPKVCLNLSYRKLTVLPAELTNLNFSVKHLLLNDNNLLIPPNEIAIFSETLTVLILCNNNLTVFPTEFGKLKNLQVLDVSFNAIGVLPREIGRLRSLHHLWINNCNLLLLPNEIGELKSLTHLGIKQNKLKSLPKESMEGLENLEWFNCEGNELMEFSDFTVSDAIYFINMSNNKLENIPGFTKSKLKCSLRENYNLWIDMHIISKNKRCNIGLPII